jgi:hypothetical protein
MPIRFRTIDNKLKRTTLIEGDNIDNNDYIDEDNLE